MAKTKNIFVCSQCGKEEPKWVGKCNDCSAWNSFVEETKDVSSYPYQKKAGNVQCLTKIDKPHESRIFCGVPELDRVLGGGVVPGSLMLLSGDPGIGKSTLLLQALHGLASRGYKVLYASGEESGYQVKLRADRINANHPNIFLTNEVDFQAILECVKETKPDVLVVDSIQTVYDPNLTSSPGSVSQIRECTAKLLDVSKGKGISTFVIGHVTKDGSVAGPRVLEHLVDTVLYLEGDTGSGYRILRAIKNRFGSTGEVGVFEMRSQGLVDVPNPSSLFVEGHKSLPGSAITITIEGSRPILVEVQSLVANSSFSYPKRVVTGVDFNRFSILCAVLEKRGGLHIGTNDIFAQVAGGFRLSEPAVDLALAASIISGHLDKKAKGRFAFVGEIGLSGEIRMVNHMASRLQEAIKMGFHRVYLPARNYHADKSELMALVDKSPQEIQLFPLENVRELVQEYLNA